MEEIYHNCDSSHPWMSIEALLDRFSDPGEFEVLWKSALKRPKPPLTVFHRRGFFEINTAAEYETYLTDISMEWFALHDMLEDFDPKLAANLPWFKVTDDPAEAKTLLASGRAEELAAEVRRVRGDYLAATRNAAAKRRSKTPSLVQRVRDAVASKGKQAKPKTIIETAEGRPTDVRKILRELESNGEYDGFSR